MKHLPKDWDLPPEDNEELCSLFEKSVFYGDGKLPYRLFRPEKSEKVPLVIYLHGADAVGDDNEQPLSMHGIGTMLARPVWQKEHPCYILAPQCGPWMHWASPGAADDVCSLIALLIGECENIDRNRIYIYGYSAGGVGLLRILKNHPELFAGAVSICGATGADDLSLLEKTPLYLIHAADDEIVKASYRTRDTHHLTHFGSRDLYEALKNRAPQIFYTEYPAGQMKERYGLNPHCSWVSAVEEKEIWAWLFSQKKFFS